MTLDFNFQELECGIVPSNRSELRKYNRLLRDKAVREMFSQLYQVERIRLDDCISKLAATFFLSKETINRIITHK
jgi:hypothetical protein